MDFALSPEQQHWHDAAVRFAREHLASDDLIEREERREFWREGWRRCAGFGVQGLPVPEEYGGQGQDLPVTIAAMEGLGYGCAETALIFAINASTWTNTIPILRYGTEAQKQRWLPGLCDGSLVGANGASEPEAGSDIFSMQSRAERRGDRWVLNGRKTWITSGPVADLFVCYATTDPSRGVLGITAFIIPRDTPGFRVVREIPKMGVRTVPMGEVAFEDCELPSDALLGREGRGAEVFNCSMEWETRRDPRQRPRHDAPPAREGASSTPGPASSSASRSASSSRSPTGSSRWPFASKPAATSFTRSAG